MAEKTKEELQREKEELQRGYYAELPLTHYKRFIVDGALDEVALVAEGFNEKQIAEIGKRLKAAGLFEVAAEEAAKQASPEYLKEITEKIAANEKADQEKAAKAAATTTEASESADTSKAKSRKK